MKLSKVLLVGVLLSLALRAQDDSLSLDPDEIPLSPDPAIQIPVDNTTMPNLDNAVPSDVPAPPATPMITSPSAPPVKDTLPPHSVSPNNIEEYKPTPANLEVRSETGGGGSDTSAKEERFNRAYTKYHKEGTTSQNWEKVVGQRTSDTYIVNKGDTLWDISGTLFGDPFYWPKVWSLNKDMIYNPHVIFPDMKIKFYQGSSKATPTLATDNQKEKTSDAAEPVDLVKETPENLADTVQADVVPRNARVSNGGRKLPSFFKTSEIRIKKEVDVQIEEFKVAGPSTNINLEFYISEAELTGQGTILEIESEFKSAGNDIFVYAKFGNDPNGIYTVLKPGKHVKSTKDEPYNVLMYEVEGEVQTLGKVNSEENLYRMRVLKTNALVSTGSILVPGRMRKVNISEASNETTANKGRIIGNLNDYGVIGEGNFVVINQGAQSGYQPNMKLPIFEDLERRNAKSLVKQNPQKVGTLVIVDSTQNYSIGYVTRVIDRVVVQDIVAMPEIGGNDFSSPSARAGSDEPFVEETSGAPAAPVDEMPPEEF